jgi:hypothetical protein
MTGPAATPLEYQLVGLTESGDVGDILSGLDQKQGRIRLQALIAEWLRMENLVVLTGLPPDLMIRGFSRIRRPPTGNSTALLRFPQHN